MLCLTRRPAESPRELARKASDKRVCYRHLRQAAASKIVPAAYKPSAYSKLCTLDPQGSKVAPNHPTLVKIDAMQQPPGEDADSMDVEI